jgi:hypothetical protein
MCPVLDELGEGDGRLADRAELGDGTSVACDGEAFAFGDSVDDFSTVISQLSDRHFGHGKHCITGDTKLQATLWSRDRRRTLACPNPRGPE